MDEESTRPHPVVPLQFNIDIQLGPDGNPWIRWQFGTPAMASTIVFPSEHAETIIDKMTEGTRKAVKKLHQKGPDIVVPDFTGIKVRHPTNEHSPNSR